MTDKNIGWLLESLEETAGVEYAVLVAADGMSPAYTDRLPRERAEKISAIASTLWGASWAYDRETNGGGVRQLVMESVDHISLLIPAGDNTMLAVRTDSPHADIGVISYAALRLAASVGNQLGVQNRIADVTEAPLA
ncbi:MULTISPECIES: roadblock/LC7 domain-containing protein [unclassified Streptomyces]|uniref:roadblock/LC7 domain-containing protein n=1 Tax=unclassified Streptomyces TaxID=2593676 RepID=UPI002365BD99|nr:MULTISPECIES: roadblock/LC7 domain-containing protein [unclassified Streptomyces]MDF3140970.1 roadblock/LC7 domain-containing protein [Streptomyces sp. T21Q-yed]WDF43636.1 roadblock/LC7 domain-containing protein [Streptomyces sp. T12]